MAKRRKADGRKARIHFRSERMEEHGGRWFFHTREGTIEGPFDGELAAQEALDMYITVTNSGLLDEDAEFTLEIQEAS